MHYDRTTVKSCQARWGRRLCVLAVLALLAGPLTAAESDPVAPTSETTLDTLAIEPDQAQVDFSGDGVVIKFIAFKKDGDVRDGLRLLAKLCRKNIVPSASVTGPLNCPELRDVTFEQALAAMLGDKFVPVQDGNLIHIRTKEEHKKIKEDPERMIHKVITLYYTTAEEAEKLIRPVLSASAQITKTQAAEEKISSASSTGSGGGSLSGGGGGDNTATNDMIVIFDFPENIEKAESVIAQIDIRPKQVLVEATILAARLTEQTQFGVDWNLLSGVAVTGFPANIVGGQGTPWETSGFRVPNAAGGLRVGFSSDNVQAIITALEEVTDTTLLANPKILAVNKQEGSVLIGKKLGYLDQTTQTQTSTTQSVAFLNTGTQLIFRPYIGSDGYIRMDIYPKDSDGSLNAQGIPDETTTELRTNVIVKDGETVILGGLFRDSITATRAQVPLLGSLPIIGAVFRGTDDTSLREEVIILLTPHIIEEPSEVGGADRADDIRLKMDGAKHNLQGLDRARMAEDAYARAAKYYLEGDVDSAVYNVKVALMMRPTYLEALRLRERIIVETDPEELERIDSIVQQAIDQQEARNWKRR
ncbi:MAG TPA: secretin N-terminal domain-containing protein [Sedimentisphaerales bacterium]|nr:secretin N-terminal domain-containing protein [Sedimentisphaerales bacterium]HRV46325.1 secretin N-terminal domain-containing protein [Sedimentisphaerales bacterium]